jgi:hypothetical protein
MARKPFTKPFEEDFACRATQSTQRKVSMLQIKWQWKLRKCMLVLEGVKLIYS